MYYNPPPQSSPALPHKLSSHHDNAWTRTQQHQLTHQQHQHQHPAVLGAAPSNSIVPPQTPGYAIYTNGSSIHHPGAAAATAAAAAMGALQHSHAHTHAMATHPSMHHHHHQNSLSQHPSYPSPPNGVGHGHAHAHQGLPGHVMAQTSPTTVGAPMMTQHWQQQLLKYEVVRSSRTPFHRARQSALAARPATKSAIPITDPNRVKPSAEPKDDSSDASGEDSSSNHPSAISAPIAPANVPENSWFSLDMGGINLKSIPSSNPLFSYTFLQVLYLSHNNLTSVPPQIASLRHLELLDLSCNALMTIPSEMGMLTNLKELLLFDNQLVTLPYELGTLHQLRMLGIEGNPMDTTLKSYLQKEDTKSLISFLRDNCAVPNRPPDRMWRVLQSEAERKLQDADPTVETLSVLCYNILCERCATERLYGYTPSWALAWKYRKQLILSEISSYDADFLCLQEVDVAQYEDYFLPKLSAQDYEGVFWPKSRANTMEESQRRLVDGCAIFYKASKYQLVEKQLIEFHRLAMQRPDFKKTEDMFNRVLQRDNIAVVALLENKTTGARFVIVNAHIHWNAQYCDVKLVQVALLVDEIDKIAARFAKYPPRPASDDPNERPPPVYTDGTKIPMIICGDYNSIPDSGVYEYLVNGTLAANHRDFMDHKYGNYTSEGLRHRLGLKSAYAPIGELPMTNYTPSFQGAIDYIWYSTNNLTVTSLLGEVDKTYLSKVVGFPNVHFPSDHIAILSEFRVKPPKETVSHPPPTFPSSGRS